VRRRRQGKDVDGRLSAGLKSVRSAATLRVRNGKLSTADGPFAETKEQLGGFIVIEARDHEEAVRLASRIPPLRFGSIEIRPIQELELRVPKSSAKPDHG
jgi:hypothetical protein